MSKEPQTVEDWRNEFSDCSSRGDNDDSLMEEYNVIIRIQRQCYETAARLCNDLKPSGSQFEDKIRALKPNLMTELQFSYLKENWNERSLRANSKNS